MAPIYDTDIAEERWSQAEWRQYELWEKIEVRIRRRKRLWILGTALAAFVLFSVPIVADQRSKWHGLEIVRVLATELNWTRKEASLRHHPIRLHFTPGTDTYRIEKVRACDATDSPPTLIRERKLSDLRNNKGNKSILSVLDESQANQLGLTGLVTEYCYDPLAGGNPETGAIGIIPVEDIAIRRTDRLSVLMLSGLSGHISFD